MKMGIQKSSKARFQDMSMTINQNQRRLLLIFLAGISLLTGLWAGLARMGWLLPAPNSLFVLVHGR